MRKLLIALPIALAGCASVTPVVPTGPGTYLVASNGVAGNGSGAAQLVAAMQSADLHCKSLGARMAVIRTQQTEPFFGRAPSGQVEFKCLVGALSN